MVFPGGEASNQNQDSRVPRKINKGKTKTKKSLVYYLKQSRNQAKQGLNETYLVFREQNFCPLQGGGVVHVNVATASGNQLLEENCVPWCQGKKTFHLDKRNCKQIKINGYTILEKKSSFRTSLRNKKIIYCSLSFLCTVLMLSNYC